MKYYLVFQPAFKYFKMHSARSNKIVAWKSDELSEEGIRPPITSNNCLAPVMIF